MGSITVAAATGYGRQALGVSVGVIDVFYQVDIAGSQVQFSAGGPPSRVFHAGWFGIGYAAGGGFLDYVTYGKYIEYTAEDHIAPNGAFYANADTLFWDLSPGTQVQFYVEW